MIELKHDQHAVRSFDSDVRVMTANVESEEWGGSDCLPRAEILFANLTYYQPDVVGLQEVSVNWTNALKTVLADSAFSILHDMVPHTDSNYCPLLYNRSRVEVVDSDAYRLSIGGPSRARTVTWGVFREKETDRMFGVMNTHLDWLKDANDYKTQECVSHYSREMQVRQLASTFVEIQRQ